MKVMEVDFELGHMSTILWWSHKYDVVLCADGLRRLWHVPRDIEKLTVSLWSSRGPNRMRVVARRVCIIYSPGIALYCPMLCGALASDPPRILYAQVEYED